MIIKKHRQKAINMSQRTCLTLFYNDYIEFKYHVHDIQPNVIEKILFLEEHVKSFETENEKPEDMRKAQ